MYDLPCGSWMRQQVFLPIITSVFQLCRESRGSGGGCSELLQGGEGGGRWRSAPVGTKRPLRLPPLQRGEGFPAQSNRGEEWCWGWAGPRLDIHQGSVLMREGARKGGGGATMRERGREGREEQVKEGGRWGSGGRWGGERWEILVMVINKKTTGGRASRERMMQQERVKEELDKKMEKKLRQRVRD